MLVCSCVCLYTDITGENKTVIRVLPGPRTPDYTGRRATLVLSHRTIEHRTRYGYRTYDENLMFTVSDLGCLVSSLGASARNPALHRLHGALEVRRGAAAVVDVAVADREHPARR